MGPTHPPQNEVKGRVCMVVWWRFVFVQWILCLGLWEALWAQDSRRLDPPLSLDGPNGFSYFLVTGSDGAPVRSLNGSPLYDGLKTIQGKEFGVSSTLEKILAGNQQESWQRRPHTPWVSRALQVDISSTFIERELLKLEGATKDRLGDLSPIKAELLQRLLFADVVTLSRADLTELQRTAADPTPPPRMISFPIERMPDGREFPWINRKLTEGAVEITLDRIDFKIADRSLKFDPLGNLFHFRLSAAMTTLAGPIRTYWRPKELWKYTDVDDLPLFFDDLKHPNYLEKGEVAELSLEFTFQLVQNPHGFWQFILLPPGVKVTAEKPSPKDGSIQVNMTYRDAVSDGSGGQTKEQKLFISSPTLHYVGDELSNIIKKATGGVFPNSDLGTKIKLTNPWHAQDPAHVQLEFQLSSLQLHDQGLRAFFDARVLVVEASQCLKDRIEELWELKATYAPLPSPESFLRQPWTLSKNGSSPWGLTTRPESNEVTMSIEASPGILELANRAAWASGLYCFGTQGLWPRSGSLPKLEFLEPELPTYRFKDGDLWVDLKAHLQLYERTHAREYEIFQRKRASQSAASQLAWQTSARFRMGPQRFDVLGLEDIQFPKDESDPALSNSSLSKSEQEFLRAALRSFLPSAQKSLFGLGVDEISSGYLPDAVNLKSFHVTESGTQAEFVFPLDPTPKTPSHKRGPEDAQVPETRMANDLPTTFADLPVRLRWSSTHPSAFFSYRWKAVLDAKWSDWSPFTDQREVDLPLVQAGRYDFEVKAMNSYFEIEPHPETFQFVVLARSHPVSPVVISSAAPKASDPSQSPAKPKAAPAPVKQASAKGPFGCELRIIEAGSQTQHSNPFPQWLSGLLVVCLLMLVRRISQQRVPRLR